MMRNGKIVLLTALLPLLFAFNNMPHVLVVGESEVDARTSITDAENLMLSCYQASLEAEKSGANITQLLNILNEAGLFLSKASLAYKNGDFNSAIDLANETRTRLDGFIDLAHNTKEIGLQQTYWSFVGNIVAPIIGSVSIVFGGLILWVLLKRRVREAAT